MSGSASRMILKRPAAGFGDYDDIVNDTLKRIDGEQWIRRIWQKDATLWKTDEAHQKIIGNSLGDFQSLSSRRAIRVHLGADVDAGLATLREIVENNFPV